MDKPEPKLVHECEQCHKTFTFKSKLDRHLLVHSQLKQYNCLYCSSSFSLPYNLSVHIRIHQGLKPYCCNFPGCGKAFTQSNNLTVHKKTHRKVLKTRVTALIQDKLDNPFSEFDRETNMSEEDYF